MMNPAGFGVFSDEGMISGPFFSRDSAEGARSADDPDGSGGLYVAGVCEEHDDKEAGSCELCNADDEGEE
jgi:hypothetical protein